MSESAATILHGPDHLQQTIPAYGSEVRRFLRGEVSPRAFRAYRVPLGIYEQKTEGLYMVRVRLGAGLVLPHQLQRIAELSRAYGNGTVHVTTRQAIQIPDLAIESTPAVLEGLLEAGLSSLGGGGDAVRNISVCPRAGVCPDEAFDVTPHALALTDYLMQEPSSFDLPRKFKIAFSGCAKDGGLASTTDLGFFAHRRDGEKGFSVYAGGGMGSDPTTGMQIESFVPENEIFAVTEAVKRVFQFHGRDQNKLESRLRHVLMRLGPEAFVHSYGKERHKIDDLRLMNHPPQIREVFAGREPSDGVEVSSRTRLDIVPEKTPGFYTVRLNLSLGHCSADNLKQIGDLAGTYGGGMVRATQTQDLLLLSVPGRSLADLEEALLTRQPELLSELPSIVSCAGAETCPLGLCRSRGLAKAIAGRLNARTPPASGRSDQIGSRIIRISGCSRGCAQHHLGDLGFEAGVRQVKGRLMPYYNVLFGATIGEGQTRFARCIGSLPAKRVPAFVQAAYEYPTLTEENLKPLVEQYSRLDPQNMSEDDYIDYDTDSPFALSDRPGACSGAAADRVKADLDHARETLDILRTADEESCQTLLRQAAMAAARALLVVFGVEAHDDRQVMDAFQSHLVRPGWVAPASETLVRDAVGGTWTSNARAEQHVRALVDRITVLFQSLDGSLRFTVEPVGQGPKATEPSESSRRVDLRGVACPLNFAKAKLALESVAIGNCVTFLLDPGEAERNVQASFIQQGQKIHSIKRGEHGITLQVQRER